MSKQEKVVCQGVKFIIRDFDECCEGQDNGFTFHVPFILSADEETVKCARSDIRSEMDHGANYELVREDVGFITNKNRFVDPAEAMKIAVQSGQYPDYELMKRKALEEIEYAKENAEYNKSVGVLGFNLYVADISGLNERIKELDKLLGRKQLRPEDLY